MFFPAVVLMSCESKLCHSQDRCENPRNPCVIVRPPLPPLRTTAGVRGDISLLFCPFLFLLSFITLFIFVSLLSFLCFFLPSSLFHCLLCGVFVSFFPLSVLACVLNIPSLRSIHFSLQTLSLFLCGKGRARSWAVATVAGYSLDASLLTCVHFPFCSAFWGQKLSFCWYLPISVQEVRKFWPCRLKYCTLKTRNGVEV